MRERMSEAMRRWVSQRMERRLREEWDTYDHRPEVKVNPFRRGDAATIQLNFYRHPRR
jgi:hypothetical protein